MRRNEYENNNGILLPVFIVNLGKPFGLPVFHNHYYFIGLQASKSYFDAFYVICFL
jgi:hypothetical protein